MRIQLSPTVRALSQVGIISSVLGIVLFGTSAMALDLDWSGQFRVENHFLKNYTLSGSGNTTADPARSGLGGYYIPGGGDSDASVQTLFARLKPRVVVNDNVYFKGELWLGDAAFGAFGDATPYTADQKGFGSTSSRGARVSAQRFWAELQTDVGTVQVGRAPLHWGLGLLWDNGDDVFDKYASTGDVVRVMSKFGAFTFIPSVIKYSAGNSFGGSCSVGGGGACATAVGSGNVTDISFILKYENPDEDFEGGLNFVKRVGGGSQDPVSGYFGVVGAAAGMNYNTFDIYGRKKFGKLSLGGELPIVSSGNVGGIEYKAFGLAFESQYRFNDAWEVTFKAGRAPGQAPSATATPSKFTGYSFHPNYKPTLILFNYNLAGFSGPNTLNNVNTSEGAVRSVFDAPIHNTAYFTLGGSFTTDKWTFRTNWAFAQALETATAGNYFYNPWSRTHVLNSSGKNQAKFMGWEMDYGASFRWDESFDFHLDAGWMFPGDYFRFANSPTLDNDVSALFATTFRVGVNF